MSCKEWKVTTLGEVINLKRGYDLPQRKRVEGQYPIIASNGISGYHNEMKVKGPGVTTGRSGTLGKSFYIEGGFWPLNTSLYVDDFKGNNVKFIYYFLQTLKLDRFNAGSGVPTLNRNHIHPIEVKIPPLEEQEKIANILSSLDDKIELNNEMNKTLEEMAQSIFKRWFVDFEFPSGDGEPYKSNGGEMVESELGRIPKGWEVKTIGDIGNVISGGTPSTKNEEYYGGDISWITPKDLSGYDRKFISKGERSVTELGLQKSSAKLLPRGTVLFSSRAPIGYVAIAQQEVCTNQGFKSIVCNDNIINSNYVYYFLKHSKEMIENISSGSTFKEISGSHMKSINIILPKKYILEQFDNLIKSYDELLNKNYKELDILKESRDCLLDNFMTGKVTL